MILPTDIVGEIMSYLPIYDSQINGLHRELFVYHFKKRWFFKYKNIPEYSLNEEDDDYYVNWLENDIISALNNYNSLMSGLTDQFRSILRRIYCIDIQNLYEFDEAEKDCFSALSNINKYLDVLTKSEIKELDRRLLIYNKRMDSGMLAIVN